MPVELRILSGARSGSRLDLARQEFFIGDQPTCDVFFDPARDPDATGECVRVYSAGEGWRAHKLTGNRLLVNHELLESEIALRSGDVIRLSESGPDLCFAVVALASPVTAQSHLPAPEEVAAVVSQANPEAQEMPVPPSDDSGEREPVWHWWILVSGLAAAAVLLSVSFLHKPQGRPREPAQDRVHSVAGTTILKIGAPAAKVGRANDAPPPLQSPALSAKPNGEERFVAGRASLTTKIETPIPSPKAASAQVSVGLVTKGATHPTSAQPPPPVALSAAPAVRVGTDEPRATAALATPLVVLAIENEADRSLEPFAIGCAVKQEGREMLLTTARIARIMMLSRDHKRYYAVLAGGLDTPPRIVEVDRNRIYMHMFYTATLERNEWEGAEYFDVGVLCCLEKFPAAFTVCTVAPRHAVEGLQAGSALRCDHLPWQPSLAFAEHKIGDLKYRWYVQREEVRLTRTLLLAETNRTNGAGEARRLFELDPPGDDFREGSPVFDDRGRVVALCTNSVPAAAGIAVRRPRAALVDAEMFVALWSGQSTKQWFEYAQTDRTSDAAIPHVRCQPSLSTR